MTLEEWQPIPWPIKPTGASKNKVYEASSLGRIRTRIPAFVHPRYPSRCKKELIKILKPIVSKPDGGLKLTMPSQGRTRVARLIALAFHGVPPFPKAEARHLNDIQTDNTPSNIAWGTSKQNKADMKNNRSHRYPSNWVTCLPG